MPKLVESIQTPLSPEAAFAYVSDFAQQSEWDPNTVSSRRRDEGPIGPGSRFTLEVRMGGRVTPMEYRITEYEAPRRVVLVGKGSGVWSEDEINFTGDPGGTRVDHVATIRLSGLLGLVQPLLGRALRSIARAAAEGMKRELDRRAASVQRGAG
ncbi:hypothetical protein BH24CHL9_BH24CHL9_05180 [soil metagenome]